MAQAIADFGAFWPFYLTQHADPRTRAVHYFGTTLGCLLLLCFAAGGGIWALIAAPIAGYGPAWLAHMVIEHNRPATFTYPLWSFAADFRMLYCAATGHLAAELERAGIV